MRGAEINEAYCECRSVRQELMLMEDAAVVFNWPSGETGLDAHHSIMSW